MGGVVFGEVDNEDSEEEPIRLLEVNSATVPTQGTQDSISLQAAKPCQGCAQAGTILVKDRSTARSGKKHAKAERAIFAVGNSGTRKRLIGRRLWSRGGH
jgi:hypothetical protein